MINIFFILVAIWALSGNILQAENLFDSATDSNRHTLNDSLGISSNATDSNRVPSDTDSVFIKDSVLVRSENMSKKDSLQNEPSKGKKKTIGRLLGKGAIELGKIVVYLLVFLWMASFS